MKKIKLFGGQTQLRNLEAIINDWIKANPHFDIISIQIFNWEYPQNCFFGASIIYNEEQK